MKPIKSLVATIRDLITLRKEQLSSLHVMLHWVEVELNKVVSKLDNAALILDSRLDDETKGRLKMLVSALEMSPIDMKRVDEFEALLNKKTVEIPSIPPSLATPSTAPPPPARIMQAGEAVKRFGNTLIGQVIQTEAMGHYPGGPAIVSQINPDIGAPDIVLNVKSPAYDNGRDIGIFDNEEIGISDDDNKNNNT
jgi:hypothetical protein